MELRKTVSKSEKVQAQAELLQKAFQAGENITKVLRLLYNRDIIINDFEVVVDTFNSGYQVKVELDKKSLAEIAGKERFMEIFDIVNAFYSFDSLFEKDGYRSPDQELQAVMDYCKRIEELLNH